MKKWTAFGTNWYGIAWLINAVLHSYKLGGSASAKDWGRPIKEALQEAPKNQRQEYARMILFRLAEAKPQFRRAAL